MATSIDFRSRISSVMEVLSNAAVIEICKVVNEGCSVLLLELTTTKKENESLKSKLKSIELLISQDVDSGKEGVSTDSNRGNSTDRTCNVTAGAGQSLGGDGGCTLHETQISSHPCKTVMEKTMNSPSRQSQAPVVKVEMTEDNIRCQEQQHEHYPNDNMSTMRKSEKASSLFISSDGTCDQSCDGRTPLPLAERPLYQSDRQQYSPETDTPPTFNQSRAMSLHEENSSLSSHPDLELINSAGQSCSFNNASSLNSFIGCKPGIPIDSSALKTEEQDECAWRETGDCFEFQLKGSKLDTGGMDEPTVGPRTGGDVHLGADYEGLDFSELPDVGKMLSARMGKSHSTAMRREHQPLPCYEDGFADFGPTSHHRQAQADGFSSPEQLGHSLQPGHGGRLFGCSQCGKEFHHLHQLKTHRRVHTGERPYSCPQCGKRFSQSSHIKRHMTVHTGERPFGCALCGKRFSQSCSLKVHQRVHTNVRPFSCTQCGKSFSVLSNLVRHQAIHMRKKTKGQFMPSYGNYGNGRFHPAPGVVSSFSLSVDQEVSNPVSSGRSGAIPEEFMGAV